MPAVYTRTGDKGDTGLFGGTRVAKDSLRVEAYGAVDEANASLGLAKAGMPDGAWRERIHDIQQRMFVLAAELASDDGGLARLGGRINDADVATLEQLVNDVLAETGPPRHFVVPGRDERSGRLHVARTMVRRAERRLITLGRHEPVREILIRYLNRLSDAVYALARLAEHWQERELVERVVREHLETTGPDDTPSFREDHLLALARELIAAAQEHARQIGVPMAVAVVDDRGSLVAFECMQGTLPASTRLAQGKAWSAVAYRQSTAQLGRQAARTLPGLEGTDPRVVLFGGGVPLVEHGRIVAGLGVSGGTVAEDCAVVAHALATTNTSTTGDQE